MLSPAFVVSIIDALVVSKATAVAAVCRHLISDRLACELSRKLPFPSLVFQFHFSEGGMQRRTFSLEGATRQRRHHPSQWIT